MATHARCFTIDQDKWPSVMGDHNGVTLRANDDACGTWVCPMHMVRWVFSRHGGEEPPSAATVARAEELEHVRQFFWFYSRSAAATVNNISSAVGRIRKFEAEMGLPCVPSVMYPECYSELAAGWFLAERASKVKMQSMGADASAFHQLFGAAGVTNPFNASASGMRSSLGRTRLGAEHVLGVQKIATARFPMAVVLAVQDLCLHRAQEATTADDKLFWLYTAFYVVVNTMAFLRPSELPKCTLHGIWSHCHTGRRARRLNLTRQYVGISFGEMVMTARGRRTIGAHTKVSRKGQKYDADLRGSDVVIVARAANGLCPGYIANKIFQLRGIPGDTLVWPSQLSKLDPLLLAANKKKLLSSGLTDSLLVRVRSVLLYLQQKGHPDLVLADVPRITNYWMKNTGASDAASRGVPEWLRNGQGRWGLLSQEPKLMVRKYIQSTLEEKLSTSDIGIQWCSAKIVSGPVPHSSAQLSSDSDY